jgi:hypothetical protein
MKRTFAAGILAFALIGALAAPAAAYSQRTTYPGGTEATWTEGICRGYGSSEVDFVQTIQLSGTNTCDYVQVRANYRNGSWVGYSNWKRGLGYLQYVAPGSSTILFGQHGIDQWR